MGILFIGGIVGAVVLVVALLAILVGGYVKASPSTALIISGIKKRPRILIGRGGARIPFFERMDKLFLGQISVDIKTETPVPTNDYINVNVDAVAKVMVGRDEESVQLAARNFLNFTGEQIAKDLQDSLEGNMREIIGTLTLEAINTDRDSFSDQVVNKAAQDMKKLGIEIISCNIQNVTDNNGLIVDLGADNTARIKKRAAISRAEAERDVAVAKAQAQKEANDAQVEADLEIAQRQTDLAIRQAELKRASDIKRAEADAAYEIQAQEQQKSVQAATVNAQIAKAEREQELKKQQVSVREQELAAQIQKQADAEKYAVEQKAAADLAKRQREAEAALYETQRKAEAKKAEAEASRYAAEQEAAGIKAQGEAEAAAIQAKGEAEAAAMDRKAEALKKYGKAAMAQMIVEILPQIASEVAKPLERIGNVSIIGGSSASAVEPMADNVPLVMAKTFQTVKAATGIDLADIVRGESYEAKVTKNVNVTGADADAIKAAAVKAATIANAIRD
ncbi:flotillin family protein [Selenomonas sp. CM52]|uniref:flotillin family protein n=1 Tax=Selenomonas sp. CM52 TaxID=936381 RepID=UPI0002EE312E|nr:flotillin family protein [Selenomonas sp. CM52]